MRNLFLLIMLTILLLKSFSAENINKPDDIIDIITGDLPPYSYLNFEKKHVGIGVSIINNIEIFSDRRFRQSNIVYPWNRALNNSLHANTIIYPLGRIESREDKYLWVGPIFNDRLAMCISKKNPGYTELKQNLKSFEDFNNNSITIGAIGNAPPMKRLISYHFQNVKITPDEFINLNLLTNNRIDVWYSTELIIVNTIKQYNGNITIYPENYEIIYYDVDLDFYLGLSPNLKELQVILQREVDKFKSTNKYLDIIKKWSN